MFMLKLAQSKGQTSLGLNEHPDDFIFFPSSTNLQSSVIDIISECFHHV